MTTLIHPRTVWNQKALNGLTALSMVFAASVGTLTATAQPAAADTCSYNLRLVTQDFHLESGVYVGYVELLYAGNCRRTQSHFHVDSTFRASHSGWNVDLALVNDKNSPTWLAESSWLNSSGTDFYSNSASIDGHPDYNFVPGLTWNYNGCEYQLTTVWWNYGNGQPNGYAPWGAAPVAGSACAAQR